MQFKVPRHWRRHTITYTRNGDSHTEIVHTASRASVRKAQLDRDPDTRDIQVKT